MGGHSVRGILDVIWLLGAAVLFLPTVITIPAVQDALWRRRLRRAARLAACTRCNAALGQDALRRADTTWQSWVAKWLETNPGTPRLVRQLWAVCPACDAPHGFDDETLRFPPLEAEAVETH